VHEVKHDGYRLIPRRDGEAVRLFARRGCRVQAAGEIVHAGRGADGVALFDALHWPG
jgi:ATP-dependent DNA ligase